MSIWLLLYRMKKITAAQIWKRVDSGAISAEEAVKICGPRPKALAAALEAQSTASGRIGEKNETGK